MINITNVEIEALQSQHRKERDGRIRDRIKAVVLRSKGWSNIQIAQALLIHVDTVNDHLRDYQESRKLKPENGGSTSNLNDIQTAKLIKHLENNSYVKVSEICAYIRETYGTKYTVSGMTQWLHQHKFSYKKPKGTPSKADPKKQEEFIKKYNELLKTLPEDEPILFGDGVHPTMATKISYGWIRTGTDKLIQTTASRTRLNLFGTLNLEEMNIQVTEHDTLDSRAMLKHFNDIRKKYPEAPRIHLILDQGAYNTSKETQESAEKYSIVLHYLPPYSPNLNPIERVWKLMNEHTRNNVFFNSAKEFKTKINNFFTVTWPTIAQSVVDRINDNFQIIKTVSSC